jgi:small-conductance mechanosensitive channel
VSNVAGNVTLARLLTATVVRASYWGVVLYAGDLLLRGTATLIVRSPGAHVVRTIDRNADLVLRRARLAIDVSAVVCFLLMTLNATGQWSLVRTSVAGALTAQWGIGGLKFSFASALVFVITLYASIVISQLLCAVLEEDVYARVVLPRGVPGTFTMLVRYGAITLGFLLAAAIAGIPLDRLAFVLGAFSVGIGFGLQTIVNNFVSGLILMFERPIQIGDTVDVGGLVGRVRHIGVRASRLETSDGAEAIVPNGELVSGRIINWTLTSRNRRIEIQVSVVRDTDPERALAVLRDAVSGTPDVLTDPAPSSLLRGFGTGTLDLSLFFWTAKFEEWTRVRSDVTVRVNQALRDAGIELASEPPPVS